MPSLSLIVITRDEERDLPRCLASVPFADQVLVVDSGSTDRTREVAAAAGATVIEQPWLGYGAQKAFAFSRATTDWVLSLDADEALSPELAKEVPAALLRTGLDGYQLRFRTEMFGRVLQHGGFGTEKHLRLFRREKGRVSEKPIHEGVEVQGPTEVLANAVLHRPYATLSEYLAKLDRYTSLAAAQRGQGGRRFSSWSAFRLPWGFLRRYVLQLGILDGYPGFLAASLGGVYELLREAKLRELEAGSGP